MTIEITSPDVEALIRQRMRTGAFKSPEDLIRAALRSSELDTRTGADLIAALQECPYPEVDIEPSRVPSPLVRDVAL
jgi:Arc/MetJ-type ribon-helix-helix transcriptional regulator